MTAPTLEDFPALGFVPCAGDADAMEHIQSAFSDTAGALQEVCAVLTGADEGEWRGLTAIAFRDVLDGDLRPKVEDAHQSFSDAARALGDWVERMREDQQTARQLEDDAAAALRDLEAAQSVVSGLPEDTRGEDPPEDETDEERQQREDDEEARDTAEQDVRIAEAALQEFRDQAEQLREDYNEAGGDIADRLRDAMDIAPNEPGLFGKIAEGLSDLVDWAMDALADLGDMVIAFLGAIAPVLAVINNVLGIIVTVLSIASIFFPALAPFALGLGAIVLATTYLQKVGETGSFTEALTNPAVIAAAVGVVLGGAGAALARAAGPSTMAAVNSMGSLRSMGFAMRPAGVYLSSGLTNTMRASNVLTGGTYAVEAYNTFLNPQGNHFGNLTGIGLGQSWGDAFTIGDANGGGPSGSDVRDNFTADRQEVGAGALGTSPDTYGR